MLAPGGCYPPAPSSPGRCARRWHPAITRPASHYTGMWLIWAADPAGGSGGMQGGRGDQGGTRGCLQVGGVSVGAGDEVSPNPPSLPPAAAPNPGSVAGLSGGLGGVGLRVGLNDPKGLFQPNSMILRTLAPVLETDGEEMSVGLGFLSCSCAPSCGFTCRAPLSSGSSARSSHRFPSTEGRS